MPRRITARLEGEFARLGEVPAADVAHLILGLERAIGRSAAKVIGRRPATGRRGGLVEAATHLKLVAVEEGSIAPVFELPVLDLGDDATLEMDVADLGDIALDATLTLLEAQDPNPDTADALSQLCDELGIGTRYERLTVSSPSNHRDNKLILDAKSRPRVRLIAQGSAAAQTDAVVGTLFEADFERRTARIRTSGRRVVNVQFAEELADEIQEVLRRQAQLRGQVHYNETTGEATRIEVQRVIRTEQLLLGVQADEFWSHPTVDELIRQHSGRIASKRQDIFDADATEQEQQDFLNAIAQ